LASFPIAKYDDDVDSTSQFLNWERGAQYSGGGSQWAVGEPDDAIGDLRRYLDGATRPGEISASTHAAVTAGKGLSDAQIQEILGSTIPGGLD
jgi:hypothetical protein